MLDAEDEVLRWCSFSGRVIHDTVQMLEICCGRLADGCQSPAAQDELLQLMAHLCLRQDRRDVLTLLEKEVRGALKSDDEKDAIQFCYKGLTEAFVDQPNLVSGNKTKATSAEGLIRWLWTAPDVPPFRCGHFVNKPFRKMYQRVNAAAEARTGLVERWRCVFMAEFCAFHWVVPYPDGNGTLISTAKITKARQFFAIDLDYSGKNWIWARSHPRPGRPCPFPAALQMDLEALTEYLNRLA